MDILLLVLGLTVLIAGGEVLVKGAVGIALKFNVSVLVVGMTIVSFGTSAPELLISTKAALQGHPDISIGNVIGSNIANISLILGLTTIIFPIPINRDSVRIDWPVMMASTLILFFFMMNGIIGFLEGLLLVALLVAFNAFLIIKSRRENRRKVQEEDPELQSGGQMPVLKGILFFVVGCTGLVFGAEWFLDGAVGLASNLGISERVIGLTIVAFGTSVPELITSAIAAFRKETDISIGNLIGSNVFNILGILGITGMVKEIPVSPDIMNKDVYWMLAISFLILPLMLWGRKIDRIKGIFLFLFYTSYITLFFI